MRYVRSLDERLDESRQIRLVYGLRNVVLRKTLGVVLAAVCMVIFVGLLSHNIVIVREGTPTPTESTLAVGEAAPPISLVTTAGEFNLKSVGKPVFLEVLATWCPHCQRETAIVNDLFRKYGGRVTFVGVTGSAFGMDHATASSRADLMNYVSAFDVAYPVAFDPTLAVRHAYLQTFFPTLVVIDKDETISYLGAGEVSEAELEAEIRKTL